ADDLIRDYIPFIRSEASKCISRLCTEQDDEYSIAMIAFHEAILGYERGRGAFLSYASMLIRSRTMMTMFMNTRITTQMLMMMTMRMMIDFRKNLLLAPFFHISLRILYM
ncbi:MAG: hypothetical protein IJN18_01425, partial [Clostridia bacterium]|nr:hypothetical protein [Clostridia bacterium]